jgi:hypothetical protein
MVASVDIEAPDGSRDSLELQNSAGWLQTRVETSQDGLYRANVRVSAQNHATEIHDIDLGGFSMLGVYRQPAASEAAAAEAVGEQTPGAPESSKEKGTDWRLVGIVVVAVNVLLMLLLLVGWLILRRKRNVDDGADDFFIEDEELSA